jgi:hypothetical protein
VKDGAQALHALQRHAAAAHHAGQRVFGHQHGQAGFFGQQAVQVAQQGAAAGQHHAAVGNVGAQFGGSLLQRVLDGGDDVVQRVGQGFQDFVAGNREAARHAFRQVAPRLPFP